ncbi:MAG: hypothetical protein JXA20_17005 [Spirochaetes bacterium]|nr:hypothetical protein [Spirochaetota bacterium]
MKMHDEVKHLLETKDSISSNDIKQIILLTMKDYSRLLIDQLVQVPSAVRKRVKSGIRASELERIILEEINQAIRHADTLVK